MKATADDADFASISPRLRALHDAHLAAIIANPDPAAPTPNPSLVARRMALAIHRRGVGAVSTSSNWYRSACRSLGIKHTRRDIAAFLAS